MERCPLAQAAAPLLDSTKRTIRACATIHCMATFTYFAYGSNMLLERLQKRCKTASFLGLAVAHGYTLAFSKKSKAERVNDFETSWFRV